MPCSCCVVCAGKGLAPDAVRPVDVRLAFVTEA